VALGRRHDARLRELHHQRRQLLTARHSRALPLRVARDRWPFGAGKSFAKFVSKFAMLCIFPLREISCEISYAVHFP